MGWTEAKYPKIHEALNDPETLKEATVIGRVDGVLCRVRYDVLPPKRYGFTVDLKFTGLSAEPEKFSRTIAAEHLFQGNFYPRVLQTVRGDDPEFQYLVCETTGVCGVSLHAMAPSLNEIAHTKVSAALARWKRAMAMDHWPDYPALVHYAEAAGWQIAAEDERIQHEAFLQEQAA